MGNKLKKSLAWLTMALMLTSQVNVVLATTYKDGSTKYIDNEASSLNVGDAIYEVEELADTDDEIAEFVSAPATFGVRNVGSSLNLNIGSSSGGLNTNIGGNNKKEQGQPKTATSKVYEFKGVKDSELKADHRYGKTVNYKNKTNMKSDFLKLRMEMEKTFGTKVTKDGVDGLLGRYYFNGSMGTEPVGDISYSRSIFNTGINKLTENNKEALAKIASETFADIKGDEPYAHLIPVAVYYGLYDNIQFETVQADNPQLGYKKGDLLFNGNKEITYAEAAVTLGNYDGVHKKFNGNLDKALAGKWFTNDLGNITDELGKYNLTDNTLNSGISKGAFAHNLVAAAGAINDRSQVGEQMISGNLTYASKDTRNMVDSPEGKDAVVKFYKNALDNPAKGTPYEYGIALGTLKKVGIKVEDANGNTNWHKGITRGEALQWMQEMSEKDVGSFPSHMIEK